MESAISPSSSTTKLRGRRSRSQWQQVVVAFKSSGLSESDFCRRESLSLHGLQRALLPDNGVSPSGFAKYLHSRTTGTIVVDVPGGIKVTLHGVDAVALIKGLSR